MSRRPLRAWTFLPFVLAGCAAPEPAPTPGVPAPIVAFGDSYTEGYGATPDTAYPEVLARVLGRPVLNKGVSGETAGEGMRRLDRDVLRQSPELVIVEFGVNEAYRGYEVDRAIGDLERIVVRIRNETDADVVIVGVRFWSFGDEYEEGLHALAERYGAGLVLDVLGGIVSSSRDVDDGDPALRADEFHPNARGYAIMAERILPVVRARLTSS